MSVQKIKRLLLLMMVVGLTAVVLAGCANPKDTTEEFLTAIQKGDVEKARTFVESDKEFNKLNEKTDDAEAKAMLSAITKTFKFEKLEEVSKKDDKDGDYKIVADDNLKEVLFANAKSLEKMFGGK